MLDSELTTPRAAMILLLAGTLAGTGALEAQSPTSSTAVAGTQRRVSFTTSEGTSLNFDISPDGRWIVFDLLGQLWRIPAEGGEAVRLTDAVADAAEDVDPTVSPDGRWIAFQGDRNGIEGLWLIPTGGGAPRLLPGTEASTRIRWKTYFRPAWSRDSRQLAFIRDNLLFLHSIDRDSTAQLTLQQPSLGTPVCIDWVADGQLLALVRPRGASGGALWFIDPGSGQAREAPAGGLAPISTGPGLISACPTSSPDGSRVAVFVEDPAGVFQLHLLPLGAGDPRRVTDDPDVFPSRVRWTRNGKELLYVAGGRIYRVSSSGGERVAVQFRATVSFEREERVLPQVRFPDPGSLLPARGHMGLALSPDGSRIALMALGQLWVWPVGARPRSVTAVPITAGWPGWAPDGRAVAWSAGAEDRAGASIVELYVTDVATGRTRQVTRLGGTASRPSWSPDGRHIAFYYRPARGSAAAPAGPPSHLAVVPADAENVSDVAALQVLPNTPIPWIAPALAQERPAWSPASNALLFHQPGCAKSSCIYGGPPNDELRIVPLAGEPIRLAPLTDAATFVQWAADSSLIFVRGNQLWRAELRDGSLGDAIRLSDEPALYPSIARDGSILYLGLDGYRIRRANGRVTTLGWPLTYRVPEPSPILIRNATIIDGTGARPRGTADVLIEKGRIARIAPAGSIRARRGAEIVNAEGRVLIPGLIDLHVHNGLSTLVPLSQLYHGITTIRDMGGPLASLVGIADAIESGTYAGPRMVFGGVRINPGAPFAFTGADIQGTRNHAESERALLLARALGASFVKMQFPARWSAGAELVKQAQALGFRIGGHCAQQLPLIAAGIAQAEHLSGCGPRSQGPPQADLITLFRHAGVTIVPTFPVFSGAIAAADTAALGARDVAPFIPLSDRSSRPVTVQEFWYTAQRKHRASVGALYAGGVRVATGSDAQHLPGVIHIELEDQVAAGLPPLAAITAATSEAARVLGAEAEIGTVAVGKHADLILLDADPLENIRNTRRIRMVIQRGRIVDRDALLQSAREQTERHPPLLR
ncbi:MAG TPA: amidohydrolase family protein [Gemmatimonadaceae bacterium]|nr:amidohydrolase family protein [Gemmatimonadaceae bacterium]